MTLRALTLAACGAALLHSTPALAVAASTGYIMASATTVYYLDGEVKSESQYTGSTPWGALAGGESANLHLGAYANVDIGVLKTYADAFGGPNAGFVSAVSSGMWSQNVTFVNEALTGQKGTTTLKHYYSGTFHAEAFGAASSARATQLSALMFGRGDHTDFSNYTQVSPHESLQALNGDVSHTHQFFMNGNSTEGGESSQEFAKPVSWGDNYLYLPIEFVWGETYKIASWQNSMCIAFQFSEEGGIGCHNDSSHSAYWGGIGEVFDADGGLVTDFQLLSADGQDFSVSLAPVPEPETIWMLGAGLALVGFARLRRSA